MLTLKNLSKRFFIIKIETFETKYQSFVFHYDFKIIIIMCVLLA